MIKTVEFKKFQPALGGEGREAVLLTEIFQFTLGREGPVAVAFFEEYFLIFWEVATQSLFDQGTAALGKLECLKLEDPLALRLDELGIRDVELRQEGASWCQEMCGPTETHVDTPLISEEVKGVVRDDNMFKFFGECHAGHIHTDRGSIGSREQCPQREHLVAVIKARYAASMEGEGATDSSCTAAKLQDPRFFSTILLIKSDILGKMIHLKGIELCVTPGTEGEKDLYWLYVPCE